MAYQTNTATDIDDLLDQLRAFAITLGWTIDNWSPMFEASRTGQWLSMHHADAGYFTLAGWTPNSGDPYIYGIGHTSFSGLNSYFDQPGSSHTQWSVYSISNTMPSPLTSYHFFGTTQYLHVVVETTGGVYKHIALGKLNKFGSYTGGEYMQMVYWDQGTTAINTPTNQIHNLLFDGSHSGSYTGSTIGAGFVRADIDSRTNNWMKTGTIDQGTDARMYGSVRSGWLDRPFSRTPSTFNAVTPLLPIMASGERVGDNKYSPLGFAPDLRYVSMRFFNPGDLLTLGGEDWLIFPGIQKTSTWGASPSSTPSSGDYGYAYKKVP